MLYKPDACSSIHSGLIPSPLFLGLWVTILVLGVCSLSSPTSLTVERLDNINADMSRLAAFEYRHRQVIGGVHSCWESATLKRQPASEISLSASRHLARPLSCRNFMFKSSRMPNGECTARTPNADVSP